MTAASSSGFSSSQQIVALNVGEELALPIQMQVAGNQTHIQVSSDATDQINTTTSVVGGVINARQIETLPLNGRNYLELALLVPGNAPAPNFDPTKENTVVISSAGQVGRGGNVTIDGADNNDDAVGGSLVTSPRMPYRSFKS